MIDETPSPHEPEEESRQGIEGEKRQIRLPSPLPRPTPSTDPDSLSEKQTDEHLVHLPPSALTPTGAGSLDFPRRESKSAAVSRALVREEYAQLHADIERAANPARCFVVGVTSAGYGEGKTTVALNLAGTMAQNSEARITLIDCNLRNRGMQNQLSLPDAVGLVDLLETDEYDLSAIVQRTDRDNLCIVPAGRAAQNPAYLARSPRLTEVINAFKMTSDFLILDLAPVLPVADTKTLSRLLDGVVMVVRSGVTSRRVAGRAIETIGSDKVLGVVLNGVERSMPRWLRRFFS